MQIVLDDVKSDDTASKADFIPDSVNQDTNAFSLEASSEATTTPSNPSPPCHHDPDSITSGSAMLSEIDVETEMIEADNGCNPSKRKARASSR